MSFIKETLQCELCKKHINVSTGTFGGGIPSRCPFCNAPDQWKMISMDWRAQDDGSIKVPFDETFNENT